MSIYQHWEKAPGATKEELALFKLFKKAEIMRAISVRHGGKTYKLSYSTLANFLKGEPIPKRFRDKIMQYVYEKSENDVETIKKIKKPEN